MGTVVDMPRRVDSDDFRPIVRGPNLPAFPDPPTVRNAIRWAEVVLDGAEIDAVPPDDNSDGSIGPIHIPTSCRRGAPLLINAPCRWAEWFLTDLLGCDRAALTTGADRILTRREAAHFRSRVARRGRGEPVQYILGKAWFRDLVLAVGPDCLIPRPETEGLVEIALGLLRGASGHRVLDIGTGSGCIALSIAREAPGHDVTATDASPAALGAAEANARALGLSDRVRFVRADLFPAGGPWDLVVSNPPYIPAGAELPPSVRDHEPAEALRAGPTGLEVIDRILGLLPERLAPAGTAVIEVDEGQGARARLPPGFRAEVRRDLADRERYMVVARG